MHSALKWCWCRVDGRVLACSSCGTHLTSAEDIISNVGLPPPPPPFSSSRHSKDIMVLATSSKPSSTFTKDSAVTVFCPPGCTGYAVFSATSVIWSWAGDMFVLACGDDWNFVQEKAFEISQKYKEGKFILEASLLDEVEANTECDDLYLDSCN